VQYLAAERSTAWKTRLEPAGLLPGIAGVTGGWEALEVVVSFLFKTAKTCARPGAEPVLPVQGNSWNLNQLTRTTQELGLSGRGSGWSAVSSRSPS